MLCRQRLRRVQLAALPNAQRVESRARFDGPTAAHDPASRLTATNRVRHRTPGRHASCPLGGAISERFRHALPAIAGLVLFVIALEVLRIELRTVSWNDLITNIVSVPVDRLTLAALLTIASYALLTGYDFLAYAIANSVGGFALSGISVGYRFYTPWGIGANDLARLVFSYSVTFWLGILALGGLRLAIGPFPTLDLPTPALIRPVGWLMMTAPFAYLVTAAVKRRPFRFRQSSGIGVFEGSMIVMLAPFLTAGQLLPPLVVFRTVYYLVPFGVAVFILVAGEVRQRRSQVSALIADGYRRILVR